jgi:hypothetical protein
MNLRKGLVTGLIALVPASLVSFGIVRESSLRPDFEVFRWVCPHNKSYESWEDLDGPHDVQADLSPTRASPTDALKPMCIRHHSHR